MRGPMWSSRSPESRSIQSSPGEHINPNVTFVSIASAAASMSSSSSNRPRATALQYSKSTSRSENSFSHSSESGTSQPSNTSSNTSWATHFPSNLPAVPSPLPKGARPPQVSPHILDHEHTSPHARRKSRVLRKSPPPPPCHLERSRWNLFSTQSRVSSPGPPRVRVNLNDDAPFVIGRLSHPVAPPPSSYAFSRRSHFSPVHEPRSKGRSTSITEHGGYRFDHVTSSSDVMDRRRTELALVGENHTSHSTSQYERRNSLPTTPRTALAHRNKPLPAPPVVSLARSSSLAHSQPNSLPQSHSPYPSRHYSSAVPSEEEVAESRFGHFSSGPRAGFASEYGHAYSANMSWSDVGHAPAWSDAGLGSLVSPVRSDTRPDVHYPISEPHYSYHHEVSNLPPTPSHHSLPSYSLSSVNRRASNPLATLPTSSLSTRRSSQPASLYTHRPPELSVQASASPTRSLSLSNCIKRTLSRFHKDRETSETRKTLSYLGSDIGHEAESVGLAPAITPWPQHEPQSQQQHEPRKLKKRTPSLHTSVSLASTYKSMPSSKSKSTPSFHTRIPTPREPSYTAVDPPWNLYSESGDSLKLGPKKHSKSKSNIYGRAVTLPPIPPIPAADDSKPTLTTRQTQSQPSTPASSVRKLTKRRVSRKRAYSAVDEHLDLILPPVRTASPVDAALKGSRFSDASRSHSTPNLGPSSYGLKYPTSPYLTLMTESPPSSPLTSESQVHGVPIQFQSLNTQDRPSFLRSQSNRRWTIAVSEVEDEQLVEELDRLRSVGWGLDYQGELVRVKGKRKTLETEGVDGEELNTDENWGKEELDEWLIARKALMVCREIVRTEKRYRDGLVRLQREETRTAPPPLLLRYLPALITASQALSARLDEDPSAWGVSAAFLGAEDGLEVAFVAWSGVVGEFFSTNKGKERKQRGVEDKFQEKAKKEKERKEAVAPVLPPVGCSDDGHGHEKPTYIGTKSTPSSWRMSMPALSQLLPSTTDTSIMNRKPWYSTGSITPTAKTPTVEDIAIQPTQRVMRYVLLYKDLLSSTPIASPARALVERALEGATRIAQRCNRAQDNAAFLT